MTERDYSSRPWIVVAGGFHRTGGMDRANLALAEYLLNRGTPVYLVTHSVAPELNQHPLSTVHLVSRPAGSFILGELKLNTEGRSIARAILRKYPGARVVVNGGNCEWGDINWVHCVHHAWPCVDRQSPLWFRWKNRMAKQWAIKREAAVIGTAGLVLANSERTRQALIELVGVEPGRIHTVYLGSESGLEPPSGAERAQSRAQFSGLGAKPLVVFVGALSHDCNKGFDTLWSAWTTLCKKQSWDSHLAVAGSGSGLESWKQAAKLSNLSHCVHFLGLSDRVNEILAAADLLVSPVRYEAYGLNVQEAIVRGVPAIVSASAGIAERFPSEVAPLLLGDPEDGASLVTKLLQWRSNMEHWRASFESFGRQLRTYRWHDMARDIVALAERNEPGEPSILLGKCRAATCIRPLSFPCGRGY